MADDREQQERRRKREEARRRREQRERRRLIGLLVLAGVILLAAVGLIWWFSAGGGGQTGETLPVAETRESEPEETAAAVWDRSSQTVIHIAAAGDIHVTDKVVASDYSRMLIGATPALANADLTVVNFEGNLCGEPYGTDTVSAPQSFVQALADAGVDVVQLANSETIHNGLLGLSATVQGIQDAGMDSVGAYGSQEEAKASRGYLIREVNGIRVAIVAFTKGMNNLGLPAGGEGLVNLLYTDYATTYQRVDTAGITEILDRVAEEQPDFTLALLHWGSEYNDTISATQESIRDLLLREGVDAIVGTHPHLVQQVVWDETAGTVVAYSLGDLLGDGERAGTNYSIVLDLEITRDNITGQTRLTGCTWTPVYQMDTDTGVALVRTEDALRGYELQALDRVSDSVYENMQWTLERIQLRTSSGG